MGPSLELYHCCMSAGHAQAYALVGFADDELIEVSVMPPNPDPNDPDMAYALALRDPPAHFRLDDYPARIGAHGKREYLIPGRALNTFKRAVWSVDAAP